MNENETQENNKIQENKKTQEEIKREKMAVKVARIFLPSFLILSIIIFIIGIYSLIINVRKTENCTEKVVATCTQIKKIDIRNKYGSRPTTYTPVFTYEYNNKQYERKYGKNYSERNKDTFEKNEKYTIFVNPKAPSQFIVQGHEGDIDTFAIVAPIGSAMMIIFLSIAYFACRKSLV